MWRIWWTFASSGSRRSAVCWKVGRGGLCKWQAGRQQDDAPADRLVSSETPTETTTCVPLLSPLCSFRWATHCRCFVRSGCMAQRLNQSVNSEQQVSQQASQTNPPCNGGGLTIAGGSVPAARNHLVVDRGCDVADSRVGIGLQRCDLLPVGPADPGVALGSSCTVGRQRCWAAAAHDAIGVGGVGVDVGGVGCTASWACLLRISLARPSAACCDKWALGVISAGEHADRSGADIDQSGWGYDAHREDLNGRVRSRCSGQERRAVGGW